MVPLSFFLRRLIFCLCLVFWIEFFWGQVALQLMSSVFVIIVLQWHRPLLSSFATNMETFNEVITLFTLYLLMCFSDFVPDPATRAECGKVYIALIIIYASVHFIFLFSDVIEKVKNSVRKLYYKMRNKKLQAKLDEKKAMYEEVNK